MTLDEALEIVVARTGNELYRRLVRHPNPSRRARYIEWIMGEGLAISFASGDKATPPLMPLSDSSRLTALARLCPYRSRQGCGCSGYLCGLIQREVSGQTCLDCVGKYGV